MSRRDNGLSALSYVRLDDVETHLVDELLDRLARAGIAAYSAPTPGRRGPYGDTVPPIGPSDSVYVDAAHRSNARTVTDSYLQEVRDDVAFSDIVAGFDDAGDAHDGKDARLTPWPVAEDVDEVASGPTIGFEGLRAGTPTSPVVRREEPPHHEDHFTPPLPPPLPEIDRISRFAWAGALGGPAFLVFAATVGLDLAGWVGFLALVAFMAGFVTLVARMQDRPPTDSGPDDGAVV